MIKVLFVPKSNLRRRPLSGRQQVSREMPAAPRVGEEILIDDQVHKVMGVVWSPDDEDPQDVCVLVQ